MSVFQYLSATFDQGYREYAGSVMNWDQAVILAKDKKVGCIYWNNADEYEFMDRVFKNEMHIPPFGKRKPKPDYVIVRYTE